MSDTKHPFPVRKFKYNGVFDFNALTGTIKEFYGHRRYDFWEASYKAKAFTEGLRKEITYKGARDTTTYIMYEIEVTILIHNLFDIEVVKGGKKQILQKGRIWLQLSPTVHTDYRKFFTSPMMKKFQKWFESKIFKHELIYNWGRRLNQETDLMLKKIKDVLGMEGR